MLVQVGKRFVSEQREINLGFAKGMRELLSKSSVFQDCHDDFIRELVVCSNRREYPPNRYLMEEGQRGDCMFVLYGGVVEVIANGRYVCKLRDGSIVGEAALLNIDNKRDASVRSLEKCDVAVIFRSIFHSILEKYPWEKRKFQRKVKNSLLELGKLVDVKEDINLEQQAIQCDALKKVPFFAGDEGMNAFAAELVTNAKSHWYRPAQVIIREGDTRCEEMYVLLKGAVEVTACGEFLGRLENDIFGEICILDLLERRTATVTATTQCHCMIFPRQVIIPVLAKYPDARVKLLEHARHRLLALNDAVGEVPADQRTTNRPGCAFGFDGAIKTEDAHVFAANPTFRNGQVHLLRAISERMETRRVEEGKVILEGGSTFNAAKDFVYWIAKGQVEVWKGDMFIANLREGACIGEMSFFGNTTDPACLARQATVKSKTSVVLRGLRGTSLQEVLKKWDDSALMERWQAEIENRKQQLSAKLALSAKRNHKLLPMDIMFMKITDKTKHGSRIPRNMAVDDLLVNNTQAKTSLPALIPPLTAR